MNAQVVSPMDEGSGHWAGGRLGFEEGVGVQWFAADLGLWLLVLAGKMDVVDGRSPGGSRKASYRALLPQGVLVCDASNRGPWRGREGPPTSVRSTSSI